MERVPIVRRTAIFERNACCSTCVEYETCKLCNQFLDCMGKSYAPHDSNKSSEVYRVIYVSKDYEDFDSLEDKIWELSKKNVCLRLIINRPIPKEVLWAVSYSEKNILQVNLDMLKVNTEVLWAQELIALAGNCGLYVVLFLYPIIPYLVKTYQVIDLLDMFRNTVNIHTMLKFSKILNVKETDGYLNFNGIPISTRYLIKTGNDWECTPEYMEKFLKIINLYSVPRKISVSICGKSDCIGG